MTSKKLESLEGDFESKKIIFDYKSKRFSSILQKEFKRKFGTKTGRTFDVQIVTETKHFDFLPKLMVTLNDIKNINCINSELEISYKYRILDDNIQELDTSIFIGLLSNEFKKKGLLYKKIKKYIGILTEISKDIKDLNSKIFKEKMGLKKEAKDIRIKAIDELLHNGSEFVLNSGSILNKNYRDRGGYSDNSGVLLKVKDKVKRSLNVELTGRRHKRRGGYDYTDKVYEHKVSRNKLVRMLADNIMEGSNPKLERQLALFSLLDNDDD